MIIDMKEWATAEALRTIAAARASIEQMIIEFPEAAANWDVTLATLDKSAEDLRARAAAAQKDDSA